MTWRQAPPLRAGQPWPRPPPVTDRPVPANKPGHAYDDDALLPPAAIIATGLQGCRSAADAGLAERPAILGAISAATSSQIRSRKGEFACNGGQRSWRAMGLQNTAIDIGRAAEVATSLYGRYKGPRWGGLSESATWACGFIFRRADAQMCGLNQDGTLDADRALLHCKSSAISLTLNRGCRMNIPTQVVSFLSSHGLKLATAESCTAGQIASYLASVPGSGACLDVGFVSYSPSGKVGLLGVKQTTMDQFGLTREEVAREMAEGALKQQGCCADVAVSNTGLADAGPSAGPPPGTQCFAWAFRTRRGEILTFAEMRLFAGGRNDIRSGAALHALARIEHYFDEIAATGRRL